MKRLIIPLLSVALLALSTGCVDQIENNPNYNPETKEVKTQFVFNIANISSPETKQSAAATQATSSQTFRGIVDAKLLTVAKQGGDGQIFNVDMDMNKMYDIATVVGAGEIDANSSHRVMEMSLPIQTNQILFYGRAPKGASYISGLDANECYGKLDDYVINTTSGSGHFSLGRRLTDITSYRRMTKYFSATLTNIMHTNLDGTSFAISATDYPTGLGDATDEHGAGWPYGFTVDNSTLQTKAISWYSYGDGYTTGKSPYTPSHELYPLEQKLATLYAQMTTINVNELRAASGEAILRIVRDLWSVINEIRCSKPLCEEEAVAKYLAEQIHLTIKRFYDMNVYSDGTVGTTCSFQPITANDINALTSIFSWMADDYKLGTEDLTALIPQSTQFNSFPTMYNLPRGATHMAVHVDNTVSYFYYPSVFNTSEMGTSIVPNNQFNEFSYYYPAELLYFGNSPIRTSDIAKKESDYPNGSGVSDGTIAYTDENPRPWRWEDDGNPKWLDFTGKHVTSSTRSVAVKYDINYGVAMLKTQVQYGATTLQDNNHAVQKLFGKTNDDTKTSDESNYVVEPNKEINVTATSFKLTGIIIGGQSKHVGWDFLPIKVNYTSLMDPAPTMPNYEEGFIYDRAIKSAADDPEEDQQSIPLSGASLPVYTLVFDNYLGTLTSGLYTDGTQLPVHVALEFYNNDQDFYGNYNMIRKGGYFYLIGILNINKDGLGNPTWHTDGYITPPYRAYGDNNSYTPSQVKRVFIQDFTTKAVFSLNKESLQHAYLTVPDLRSSSLSLGLSVDLSWQDGLDFGTVGL